MFGSVGIFGSKGMSRVPNLSGLSTSAAITSIQTAGLVANSTGTVNTGDSGLNGKIASQSPASNTLVNYESTVSYTSYVYVPSCTAGWVFTSYGDWSTWSTCSGGTRSRSRAINGYYLYSNCSTGSVQQYDTQTESESCCSTVGQSCSIGYSCATVGCSFCCPDLCYRAGTVNSSCVCANPTGSYFC